jgi:hypothetical protein
MPGLRDDEFADGVVLRAVRGGARGGVTGYFAFAAAAFFATAASRDLWRAALLG